MVVLTCVLLGAAASYQSLYGYMAGTVSLESAALNFGIATGIILVVAQIVVFIFEATSDRPVRRRRPVPRDPS